MKGYIRKKDNNWQFTVDTGTDPITGKRKRKSKGGFRTKKECEAAMAEMITTIEKGQYFEASNMSLEDYMQKWIKEYAEIQVAYSTYKRYCELIDGYINKNLGKMELSKLKPLHVQEFYSRCINEYGLSSTTTKQIHAILNKALNQAVKWQIINVNPCLSVEKPKKAKVEMLVLDEIQLNKLLDRTKDMTIFLPILIGATTGMRLGEICGITWDNVDLKGNILYVKQQLQEVKGSLELVALKTKSSKRKIILLDYTINMLKEARKKQLENKLMLGDEYVNSNFVVQQWNGKPYNPKYISRNFRRVIKEYGIAEELKIPSIRFHDLRHTHATLLLKAGVNPKVVAERLGHTTVNMTLNTYSHVLPDMQKDAVDKLNNLLAK
jgi:integrase